MKGDEEGRRLPLPPFAVEMLRRRQAARPAGVLPLFPDSAGGWRDPSNTSRSLREARGTEGFAWVSSHVFRKTCATILDEAGPTARVGADQLGHSKVSMTQDVYMGRGLLDRRIGTALEAA
jgi:integrase